MGFGGILIKEMVMAKFVNAYVIHFDGLELDQLFYP